MKEQSCRLHKDSNKRNKTNYFKPLNCFLSDYQGHSQKLLTPTKVRNFSK